MSDYLSTQPSPILLASFPNVGSLTQGQVTSAVPSLKTDVGVVKQAPQQVLEVLDPISFDDYRIEETTDKNRSIPGCFWACLGGPVATTAAAGGAAIASGTIPKKWIGVPRIGDQSRWTSLPSIIVHKNPKLANVPIPKWFPNKAPIFGLKIPPFKIVKTTTKGDLIRFVGRWIPGIGWGLLAADLALLDRCIAKCRNRPSFLMQFLQETIFPKPAY